MNASAQKTGFIIAIDGPVASGKGTIAPKLAKKLDGYYLQSGVVFRCIGLLCIEGGIDTKNESGVNSMVDNLNLTLGEDHVLLNGRDVTVRIKQEDVSRAASDVGIFAKAREKMVALQREIANQMIKNKKIVVIEGRDIGTVVFPDAAMKIFLTATPEIRAKRRLAQIHSRGETDVAYETVFIDTVYRDTQDTNRKISPLVKDPEKNDYHIVDNSELSEEQTMHAIMHELQKKALL